MIAMQMVYKYFLFIIINNNNHDLSSYGYCGSC